MRDGLTKFLVVAGVGLAVVLAEGCKQKAAPVVAQPVVRSLPRAPSEQDFRDAVPVDDEDSSGAGQGARGRHRVARPVQAAPAPVVDTAAVEAAQRRQDARLLQQQQTASQAQQRELNQVVEQSVKAQQSMQAEPRIQDTPPQSGLPPVPDQPRIQDAPGPAETQPVPPPPPPVTPPQI
jgi:hypothetical protein